MRKLNDTKAERRRRFRRWYERNREKENKRYRDRYHSDPNFRMAARLRNQRYLAKNAFNPKPNKKCSMHDKITVGLVMSLTGLEYSQLCRLEKDGYLEVERSPGNRRRYTSRQLLALLLSTKQSRIETGQILINFEILEKMLQEEQEQ